MNTKKFQRREFVKVLTLSCLSLYFTSCDSDSATTQGKKVVRKYTTKNNFKLIKEKFQSNNVVFLTKRDTQYEKLRTGFNLRVQKNPYIIALCKNTEGVAESIKYAKKYNLPVSIKSGGHSFEGFSSNNGGMSIDLSLMNNIEWLDDTIVQIGPACKLGQLYNNILPRKRIIPAGSCAGVGIAGLALGGGYGFFSRKYGLTCDSLMELTMVDGEGKIHTSADNDDLLWACRGGGNGNFGIVTNMKFKTYEAPDGFTSHRFKVHKLDTERARNLLEKWFELMPDLPLSCFSAFVLNGKTLTLLITNYEGETEKLSDILKIFSTLCDETVIGKQKGLAGSLKTYYGVDHPIYFKNASAGLYKGYNNIKDCIAEVIEIVQNNHGLIYQVNTLGGTIQNPDFEKVSSYAHRASPFLSELQAYWDSPKQEKQLVDSFAKIQSLFAGNGIVDHYCNYPDMNFENYSESYYGVNYARLQDIKRQYDPNNIIQHAQSIKI